MGNRNKAQATQRLIELGITPGYIAEEEAAAFCGMSTGTFRKWYLNDPSAPQPHWFGTCKRFRVLELDAGRRAEPSSPTQSASIMAAIDAVKPA